MAQINQGLFVQRQAGKQKVQEKSRTKKSFRNYFLDHFLMGVLVAGEVFG